MADKWLRDADLAGYNSDAFDLPILEREFIRAGFAGIPGPKDRVTIDAYTIEKVHRPRTLENVYAELTGRELGEDAHDALVDARATLEVLREQFRRYELIGSLAEVEKALHHPFVDRQHRFMLDEEGYLCLCFGKHGSRERPARLLDVERRDRGYIDFMLRKFDPAAVELLQQYQAQGWRGGVQ